MIKHGTNTVAPAGIKHVVGKMEQGQTSSGAVASFDALPAPLRSCVVGIEPVQDLHGYDNPWPAGGGKNLLDLDKASYNNLAYGLNVSRDGDGVRITGTATRSGNLSFNLITNYSDGTLNGKGYVLQVFDVTSGYSVINVWGFRTEGERAFAISLGGITQGQVINCFMRLSVAVTSQTAWTPYSNICPISGWTGVNVTISPTLDAQDGTTIPITFPNEVGTVYGGTLDVVSGVLTVDSELEVFNEVKNGNIISRLNQLGSGGSVGTVGDYSRISFAVRTDADQSKYNRTSSSYTQKMCNMLKHSFAYNEESSHWYRNTVLYAFFPTTLVGSTIGSVVAYLTSIKDTTPLSFWIPLATPIAYQLTPQQITALLGQNNVWADAGDSAVGYWGGYQVYGVPSGYTRLAGITFAASTYYEITGFRLRGSDTVRFGASFDKACDVFGCYTTTSATNNYSLYMSTSSGSKYLRYNGGTYASYVTSSQYGDRYDIVITPTGSSGLPNSNDSWTERDFVTSVDMCIGTTNTGATASKFDGNMYGDFVVDGRFRGVPVKRDSDNKVGYYDVYTDTFYEPIGSNPVAIPA